MTGAELLIESLLNHNIRHIFGHPGDETSFFKALTGKKISFITTRHEQGAAFMADAYARITGDVGVCYSTLGPGATNLATGVANAYLDRSPVIAISDQIETSELHKGAHQYIDLKKFFEPITKTSLIVEDTETIPQVIDFAIQNALQERPGPIHLTIPKDVLRRDVYLFGTSRRQLTRKTKKKIPDKALVNKIAAKVGGSASPILVVGNLVIRKNLVKDVVDFAEHLKIPTFTTYMGKGAFPESHPLSLGVLSRHAKNELAEIFNNSDLIVLLGFDYSEGVKPGIWAVGQEKTVISFDESIHSEGIFYKPDIVVTQMVGETLVRVKKALKKNIKEKPWFDVPKVKSDMQLKVRSRNITERNKMTPEVIMGAISATNGRNNMIVTADVGLNKYAVGLCLKVETPKSVLFSNGLSSMGFSLPAAIGAKIADRKKTVISISGDGGFMMNVQELETCKRLGVQIIIIILRDNSLGLIKRMQKNDFKSHLAVDFGNPDFVLLAKSFGIKGSRVTSTNTLKEKLKKAVASKESYLIEVPITYESWLE